MLPGDFTAAQLDIDYLERLNPSTNDEVLMMLFICFMGGFLYSLGSSFGSAITLCQI